MAFKRWGCEFDGPWPNTDILKPRPGIWVIWRKTGSQWEVLEVGESRNVRTSVLASTTQWECEEPGGSGSIHYSASYMPDLGDAARRELAARVERIARPRPDSDADASSSG